MTIENRDTPAQTPGTGHFEFQTMNSEGWPTGRLQRIKTVTGLILNCHTKCDPMQITRLAEIARTTPDYPVDLTAWDLYGEHRHLAWSARIHWRTK